MAFVRVCQIPVVVSTERRGKLVVTQAVAEAMAHPDNVLKITQLCIEVMYRGRKGRTPYYTEQAASCNFTG